MKLRNKAVLVMLLIAALFLTQAPIVFGRQPCADAPSGLWCTRSCCYWDCETVGTMTWCKVFCIR